MNGFKKSDYYESNKMFQNIETKNNETYRCLKQIRDKENDFVGEMYILDGKIKIVQFHKDGNGFSTYSIDKN